MPVQTPSGVCQNSSHTFLLDSNFVCQGLAAMDAGARDSLADVISKSLVKLATQPEGKVIF